MKKRWIRTLLTFVCCVLAFSLWILLSGGSENYHDKYDGVDLSQEVDGLGRENTYGQYLSAHKDAACPASGVEIDVLSAKQAEGVEVRTMEDGAAALYTDNGSVAEWTVTVPESGFYHVELTYYTVPSRGVDVERIFRINGELPFSGAETLLFSRMWTDAGEVKRDNQGNEIRPSQIEAFGWQKADLRDAMGYTVDPYRFYFEAGENTVSLEAVNEPVYIGSLTLAPVKTAVTYAEYAAIEHAATPTDLAFTQVVQGESSKLRSTPSLYAKYDRSSPATVPSSVTNTVLNYIGGTAWNTPGEWIEWDVTVPEDGYYNITVKGRQNYQRGGLSCRSLYIDGEIPFAEMKTVTFFYKNEWNLLTLGDDKGTPYRFFLTKGDHKIRLEATLGEMGSILEEMQDSIYRLNQIYRKVLILTGVNPDAFRDYNIAGMYPEVISAMDMESKRLYQLVDRTVAVTGQKSDRIASAQTLAVQLEKFVDDNDRITRSFTNFKDNITALGTSMQNMSETKLDIDYLVVTADGVKVKGESENFIDSAIHEVKSCVASFFVDYNMLGDVYTDEDEVLEVWIMTGRDQSTVLKTIIDDSFTPKTGIKVNVKLVDPSALLGAVVAGNGPDIVVSTDTWNPVQYALRGAAENLRQFPDCDDVLKDFLPSAYAAMSLDLDDNGVTELYALPETQTFNVLFYREDVLNELGVPVPETWDDVIAILPTIQGNNLSIGVPYPDYTMPNLSVYYTLIYQHGGQIYNPRGTKTVIDTESGVQAFKFYTSLFNDYGLPTVFDFVSRFRSGEMPLGVMDYSTYNTLMVSAPEIRGLWDFTLVPGTVRKDENGETIVDRSVHSQGATCMMISTDDPTIKKNGWEFMKWWVSAESQVRFGREIESVLGASARYATANVNAFKQLAWSTEQIEALSRQRATTVGFREIAGGYYTQWHMINAVRKVINEKTDPRENLLDYTRTINEEIQKKRTEFGLALE